MDWSEDNRDYGRVGDDMDDDDRQPGPSAGRRNRTGPTGRTGPFTGNRGSGKKKQSQNPFFLFMAERRKMLEEDGQKFPLGWCDVAVAVGHEWAAMPDGDKMKYKQLALDNKVNQGGQKIANMKNVEAVVWDYEVASECSEGNDSTAMCSGPRTSMGVSVESMEQRRIEAELAREQQFYRAAEFADMVYPVDHYPFILIEFNVICRTDSGEFIPCEVSMSSFTLREGIIDCYSSLIDIGEVPYGYGAEVHSNSEKYQIPRIPFDESCGNIKQILTCVKVFVERQDVAKESNFRPLCPNRHSAQSREVFCFDGEVEKVEGCLEWMSNRSGKSIPVTVLPYGTFIHALSHRGAKSRSRRRSGSNDSNGKEAKSVTEVDSEGKRNEENPCEGASALEDLPTPGLSTTQCTEIPKEGTFPTVEITEKYLGHIRLAGREEFTCLHHYLYNSCSDLCSLAILNRIAFNTVDFLMPLFDVEPNYLNYPEHILAPEGVSRIHDFLRHWGAECKEYPELRFNAVLRERKAAELESRKMETRRMYRPPQDDEQFPVRRPTYIPRGSRHEWLPLPPFNTRSGGSPPPSRRLYERTPVAYKRNICMENMENMVHSVVAGANANLEKYMDTLREGSYHSEFPSSHDTPLSPGRHHSFNKVFVCDREQATGGGGGESSKISSSNIPPGQMERSLTSVERRRGYLTTDTEPDDELNRLLNPHTAAARFNPSDSSMASVYSGSSGIPPERNQLRNQRLTDYFGATYAYPDTSKPDGRK